MRKSKTKPVSIFEMPDGKKMIRVKTLDEDFLLSPKHLDNGKSYDFEEAMERLTELGLTTFDKKQALVMAAYHDEINKAIEVLDGDKLNWEYSVSELYEYNAVWYYYSALGTIEFCRKTLACHVRPVIAFPSKSHTKNTNKKITT